MALFFLKALNKTVIEAKEEKKIILIRNILEEMEKKTSGTQEEDCDSSIEEGVLSDHCETEKGNQKGEREKKQSFLRNGKEKAVSHRTKKRKK